MYLSRFKVLLCVGGILGAGLSTVANAAEATKPSNQASSVTKAKAVTKADIVKSLDQYAKKGQVPESKGIGLGSSLSDVKSVFGVASSGPDDNFLVYKQDGGNIYFGLKDGKVIDIQAGEKLLAHQITIDDLTKELGQPTRRDEATGPDGRKCVMLWYKMGDSCLAIGLTNGYMDYISVHNQMSDLAH